MSRLDNMGKVQQMHDKNLIRQTGQTTFKVKSFSNPDIEYDVDLQLRTCTCPYFVNRNLECKHINLLEGKK